LTPWGGKVTAPHPQAFGKVLPPQCLRLGEAHQKNKFFDLKQKKS
jgi:hypothetical protein